MKLQVFLYSKFGYAQAIADELGDEVTVMTSTPHYIEMFPINSGKGFSVKWLCKHLNIPLENALAAGDEMNDISMIEAAGVGIAMKNGRDFVKDVCGFRNRKRPQQRWIGSHFETVYVIIIYNYLSSAEPY